jgi:hypothetical protein
MTETVYHVGFSAKAWFSLFLLIEQSSPLMATINWNLTKARAFPFLANAGTYFIVKPEENGSGYLAKLCDLKHRVKGALYALHETLHLTMKEKVLFDRN